MSVNQDLMDRIVEHAIYLGRYTQNEIEQIVPLLDTKELKQLLIELGIDEAETSDQVDAFLLPVFTFMTSRYARIFEATDTMIKDLAEHEMRWNVRLLKGVTKQAYVVPNIDEIIESIKTVPFNGMTLGEWYAGLEDGAKSRVQQTVRMGVLGDMNLIDIINSVIGTKSLNYTDGVEIINMRGLETMIATLVTHIVDQAQIATYNANSDKIDRVQWISVLDSRTSAVCRARSGKIFPVDSGPRPPAHPRCRSRVVPLIAGQPPSTEENYQQWLTRQSDATQKEILGAQKAKLFRDGKLSLDRFVDTDGKPYNLKQLRERDAEAFRRAKI